MGWCSNLRGKLDSINTHIVENCWYLLQQTFSLFAIFWGSSFPNSMLSATFACLIHRQLLYCFCPSSSLLLGILVVVGSNVYVFMFLGSCACKQHAQSTQTQNRLTVTTKHILSITQSSCRRHLLPVAQSQSLLRQFLFRPLVIRK